MLFFFSASFFFLSRACSKPLVCHALQHWYHMAISDRVIACKPCTFAQMYNCFIFDWLLPKRVCKKLECLPLGQEDATPSLSLWPIARVNATCILLQLLASCSSLSKNMACSPDSWKSSQEWETSLFSSKIMFPLCWNVYIWLRLWCHPSILLSLNMVCTNFKLSLQWCGSCFIMFICLRGIL